MARQSPYAFDDLRPAAWDAAASLRPTPMQHHIWARAYANTLADGAVEVYTVGGVDAPQALAPFAKSVHGSGRWTLLGAEDLWESVEVSATSDAAAIQMAEVLARSGRALRFGHYPSTRPFVTALRSHADTRAVVVTREVPDRAMPSLALDKSWAEPASKLSSRRRSDLKRMRRIAEEFGKLSFEVVAPGPDTVDALVSEAIGVEARNWKGRSGTAIAKVEPIAAFYRDYARRAAERGILRLCFLRIDGEAAAMQFAVACDNAFWLIKIGYDDAFKRCSPGNLLMHHTIGHAAREGMPAYEFLGKESEWTKLWTQEACSIANLRLYPLNFSGAVVLAGDAAIQIVRNLKPRDASPVPAAGEPVTS